MVGSPLPVYITIHPMQLGKPVKIWKDLSKPVSITANSRGEIIVTEKHKNILKFASASDGYIATVDELQVLRRTACDRDDNIYCIDQDTNNIFVCNKQGENKVINIEVKGIPGRSALLILNNCITASASFGS